MQVLPSRTGEPTAVIAGVALHSRYDPVREAQRFVESGLPVEPPSVVLLLGGDLGHLPRALGARLPGARALGLFYDRELYERSLLRPAESWHPGMGEPPGDWLRRRLSELDLDGLALLEWPPASRIWPEQARRVRGEAEQVLRELRGTLVTTRGAGSRWIRNSVLNFRFTPRLLDRSGLGAPLRRSCWPSRGPPWSAPGAGCAGSGSASGSGPCPPPPSFCGRRGWTRTWSS